MKTKIYLMSMIRSIFIVLFILSASFCYSQAPSTDEDYQMVYEAVENYLLGLYDVEPERIALSVDTALHKIGYYDYDGKSYNHVPMTYDQLYELAGKWNKEGNQVNEETPREIDIYEVHDKTASAKLTAKWGIDFMHLCKVNEEWKIMNIMWQSAPK